jgi:hypothetical protein
VGTDGYPQRQIEQYDKGVVLRYGPEHPEDDFGFLTPSRVADWDRPADQEISAEDFEAVWKAGPRQDTFSIRDDRGPPERAADPRRREG